MEYRDETVEQEDFYQMYLDDLQEIVPCKIGRAHV